MERSFKLSEIPEHPLDLPLWVSQILELNSIQKVYLTLCILDQFCIYLFCLHVLAQMVIALIRGILSLVSVSKNVLKKA